MGSREEPFLEALLSSLAGAVDTLIVNDNAHGQSPHTEVFSRSNFGRSGGLIVDRSRFVSFAAARNRCLNLHAEYDAGDWVAFVDADEIHGEEFPRIASRLGAIPPSIDFIDGYTWHFFQSLDYYTSIERRMTFFRYAPELRWKGDVHEKLSGQGGARLALPYVYPHYGHTLSVRRHAEKGRQYSSLGASGEIIDEGRLPHIDPRKYFRTEYPRMLRFRGRHPAVAKRPITRLREQYADEYALTHRIVTELQTPRLRIVNAVRRLNYEQRWRLRALLPLARALTTP